MLKPLVSGAAALLTGLSSCPGAEKFNYAEALQKSLYFYEAQQNGKLSPNNRVEWRGDSCLEDGKDIGHNLAGGWFDAGDHWPANLTMAYTATMLAYSALERPEGWLNTGQMDELLESLHHVNDYFLRCVLNPGVKDPAHDLEVAVGCGGREGVEGRNVHSMWAGAELAGIMTDRPTFILSKKAPGGDIPAAMAGAMTATAMLFRAHGEILAGKNGYGDLDVTKFSDELLYRAGLLTEFAIANMGPALAEGMDPAKKETILKQRNEALRSDGKIVAIGYRSSPVPHVLSAMSWLARGEKDAEKRKSWQDKADVFYDGPYKSENYHDWWLDSGWSNLGRVAVLNLLQLSPDSEKFHAELQYYCTRFTEYKSTPGGLGMREWSAHEYGSLRHANGAAAIALYYSDLVEKAPVISGNTWWKGTKTNAELKELYIKVAKRQVDYALGANPYGRSYVVGFGNDPFNNPHHRGAYGSWAGFEHFIPGKPEKRGSSRHMLYGALIAGPDNNDVFLCGKENRPYLLTGKGEERDFFYQFPNRKEPVRKEGYVFDKKDQPIQDVMDSQFNEVALDYNAGFTANLAWLCANGMGEGKTIDDSKFPLKEKRDESLDLLTTDREFFVSAKALDSGPDATEIEATLWNRSRWPARIASAPSFRYYFSSTTPVEATVSDPDKTKSSVHTTEGGGYVEVVFPDTEIYPGTPETNHRTVRLKISSPGRDASSDFSHEGIDGTERLLPRLPVYADGKKLGGKEPGEAND